MREIPLTQGFVAIVDDEDYEELSRYSWSVIQSGKQQWYARRVESRKLHPEGKQRAIYMHVQIMGFPPDKQVDHINRNTLDNRRENLRLATSGSNNCNKGLGIRNKTGYKGVVRGKYRWEAFIKHNGIAIRVGNYLTAEEAARARDAVALRLQGEFAYLNFPLESR